MKGIFAFSFLFLLSVPALGQTYLAHNHPELYMDESKGAILLEQTQDANWIGCEDAKNPQHCLFRKAPRYKRDLGATFSVLCTGRGPFSATIKKIVPESWGHNAYVVAVFEPAIARGAICIAKKGANAWGRKRLKRVEQNPLNRSDLGLIKRRVTKRFRRHLVEKCREVNENDDINCDSAVKRAVERAEIGLYSVRLPGSRVGIAVASLPDLWDQGLGGDEGGEVEVVATIDAGGSVVEILGAGPMNCETGGCGHVLGIGDLDGDGFDDLLFDGRGEGFPGMGPIGLIRWKGGNPLFIELGTWMGG